MTDVSIKCAKRWYVAKTKPNAENKAIFHLSRQGFNSYAPRFLRRIRHARKISWQPRPLFPSYLFIFMSTTQQRWRAINSTTGISHLLCNEKGPVALPFGVVEEIKDSEDKRGLVLTGHKFPFRKGDAINILSGAFADHIGRFEEAADDEKAIILLELLGREVRTKVKLDAIAANA